MVLLLLVFVFVLGFVFVFALLLLLVVLVLLLLFKVLLLLSSLLLQSPSNSQVLYLRTSLSSVAIQPRGGFLFCCCIWLGLLLWWCPLELPVLASLKQENWVAALRKR